MDRDNAYQSTESVELYDAVFAGRDDGDFWRTVVAAGADPVLELGCGPGRVLLRLARAGHEVTGLDLSPHMIDFCRTRLRGESDEVRDRVDLLVGDMTAFELGRVFGAILVPFGGFQHLLTVEQQLACLERCAAHLRPGGRLVLDLLNADPAPVAAGADDARPAMAADAVEESAPNAAAAGDVELTDGRRVGFSMTETGYRHADQCMTYEVVYDVVEADGSARRLVEATTLRYIFRFELEHLLARAGFRLTALYGDYDCSAFGEQSPALIAVAEREPA